MLDTYHNRLAALVDEMTIVMEAVVEADGMFYQVRKRAREVAETYPEFIVFSPEVREGKAVVDVWDQSWEYLASVSVQVSQKMIDAPMW